MAEDVGRVAVGDQALVNQAPTGLGRSGFDPSRGAVLLEQVDAFTRESNKIEGILRTTGKHVDAHIDLLNGPITIPKLIGFVAVVQPNARFRNDHKVPGVRVGNHIAPQSGPHIEHALRQILAMRDPWEQHLAYETLHPFTDGNGRSGRAVWLHRHFHEPALDRWAIQRGFLHSWYYHTLSNARLRDSDGSGEADETRSGSAVGDSAGRQASPTPSPETPHEA